jgi:hypothetical protein
MIDQEFLSEAARVSAPVDPVSGADIQQLVIEMLQTPSSIVKDFQTIVGGRL